jgi:hypothetical protein
LLSDNVPEAERKSTAITKACATSDAPDVPHRLVALEEVVRINIEDVGDADGTVRLHGLHIHMLFLDGVYVEHPDGSLRWAKAPARAEFARLPQALAQPISRHLERQGL